MAIEKRADFVNQRKKRSKRQRQRRERRGRQGERGEEGGREKRQTGNKERAKASTIDLISSGWCEEPMSELIVDMIRRRSEGRKGSCESSQAKRGDH
jgi:hypothetical protein